MIRYTLGPLNGNYIRDRLVLMKLPGICNFKSVFFTLYRTSLVPASDTVMAHESIHQRAGKNAK